MSNKDLQSLLSNTKTDADFEARLATPAVRKYLVQPVSGNFDNVLSYAVRGYFESRYGGDGYRIPFVTAALDALEKAEPDAAVRAKILTSSNALGQTVFHMTMRYGGNVEMFEKLSERLEQWAGKQEASQFIRGLLTEPLGVIDHDISYALQDVRRIRTFGTPEYEAVDMLTTDSYKPATLKALTATVDAARPVIREWLDQNPPKQGDSYGAKKHANMTAFVNNLDAVEDAGSLLLQTFPGPMFGKLLDLQQQFAPLEPKDRAESIFNLLSKAQPDGGTVMHTTWQNSVVLGPPSSAGMVTDSLGPLIASFDKMLGTEAALPLVAKLLQLQDAKGNLPLDNFQYNDLPRRDYYVEGFLTSLRKELDSREKFTQYVKEVVAAVLPADYRIAMNAYEPEEINPATGQPKPKRGASLDW